MPIGKYTPTTDDFEPLRSDQRAEDLEVATNAVASTLELLARVPTASMVHDEMDEVLGMLARVLRNPGILT